VVRPGFTPSGPFLTTIAVLLALCHAVLGVTATTGKSMTSDEIAHLTAGQAYNTRTDFRLQPENGNLPQRLAALPMTIAHVSLPPTTLPSWQATDIWNYGRTFFYNQGLLADQWLFLGRAMIALLSAVTGLLVFFWSRALFGWRGGFLSLLLFVFCPAFLAHGALTTSDAVMTFFFLASVGAWWRHLERPGIKWAAVSAITLGLAFVAKFSAVLLPPMLGVIGVGWAIGEVPRSGWRSAWKRLAGSAVGHAVTCWAIIWFFYGFRFTAFVPELSAGANFDNGWGWALTGLGAPARIIWPLKDWHILPEAWLYGLAFVVKFARARGAFMSGEYSITGWVTFFPFAFLIKTTLPLLLLLGTGLIVAVRAAIRRRTARGTTAVALALRPLLPLAVLFMVYWGTSLASNLNIGHRHILPTYPVLFIAAGWLGQWWNIRKPVAAACISAALLWHARESFHVRPHYLAYFNQIVGGPQNGWRHLVDSSLDWGQDLPGLKRWLDANARHERIFLSYFGTGDPVYEGITATALPTLPVVGPQRPWHALTPGVYAVSATMLQHVYSNVRGPWTLDLEKRFQELRLLEPTFLAYQSDTERRAALLREASAETWNLSWKRYEELRFARLCYYLRVRKPDAVIGHSIFIHRLDARELDGAVGGSLKDWTALIERVASSRGQ
jgi:hypothetical protein